MPEIGYDYRGTPRAPAREEDKNGPLAAQNGRNSHTSHLSRNAAARLIIVTMSRHHDEARREVFAKLSLLLSQKGKFNPGT